MGRAAACAALMTGVLLSGCGSGTPPSAQPVRIGAVVSIGAFGLTAYNAAYNASVRDINQHGGIHGHQVQIDVCDDHDNPTQAQACARKMVSDGVIATAGDISEFSMVEAPILDEAGIAQVGSEGLNPEDFALPTAFPLEAGIFSQMAGGMVGARRRGLHSVYVVTIDTPSGHQLGVTTAQFARAAGLNLLGTSYLPLAATDFTPYVQAAAQSKADIVFPALPPTQTGPFLATSRAAGAHYLVIVPTGEFAPADIAQLGGRDAITANDVEFAALPPVSAVDHFPALKQFASDMDAELRAGDKTAAPEQRANTTELAWVGVQIIARLAQKVDVVDAAHVLTAFKTQPFVDTLGLTPQWAAGRTGPPQFPRVTQLYGYLATQVNGVEQLADPTPINPFQAGG